MHAHLIGILSSMHACMHAQRVCDVRAHVYTNYTVVRVRPASVVMAMVVEMAAVAHSTAHPMAAKPTSHDPDRTHGQTLVPPRCKTN